MKLPQITLRELFLLVVMAAIGCGWWVYRQQFLNTIEAQQNLIHQLAVEEGTAKLQLELLGTRLRNETEKNRRLEKKLRKLDQYKLQVLPYVPETGIDG